MAAPGSVRHVPVTAALCPHPPLLLPEVAGPADGGGLRALRAACLEAVGALLAPGPARTVVVGPGGRTAWLDLPRPSRARAAVLGGFGVPSGDSSGDSSRDQSGDPGSGADEPPLHLPLSLAVGSWLLERAGGTRHTAWLEVDADADPQDCRKIGEELGATYDALLVLGDGSNRHGLEPPGGADDRAAGFDGAVATALAEADGAALLAMDPRLAAELGADGRAAWQVLAGWAGGRSARGHGLYDAAPFGVGYHVATWSTPARVT